jgi:hypothetical protein
LPSRDAKRECLFLTYSMPGEKEEDKTVFMSRKKIIWTVPILKKIKGLWINIEGFFLNVERRDVLIREIKTISDYWFNNTWNNLVIFLGHVCFPEFIFRETTFQTFLCLFAIRKVGQRKTLSGQRKTLSSQRKIWFDF